MDSQKIPLRFKVLRYRASMERPNERTTGRTFTINLGKVPSFLSTIYPRCNGAGIKSAVAEEEADKEGDTHATRMPIRPRLSRDRCHCSTDLYNL